MNNKYRAFIHRELFEIGIGEVVVLRRKNQTTSELGLFLVDAQCCGVKNAIYSIGSEAKVDGMLSQIYDNPVAHEVQPGEARHLVESAVAYAGRNGLLPHPDYRKACRVLGGLLLLPPKVPWQFGKDGAPLYVQGPHDSPAFIENVMRNLHAHTGNKFDYILEMEAVEQLERRGIELPNARNLIETVTDVSEIPHPRQEKDIG